MQRRRTGKWKIAEARKRRPLAHYSADESEEEEEKESSEFEYKLAELQKSTDGTTKFLDSILAKFNPRWRNWIVRVIFSFLMIVGFVFIIYLGPIALMLLTLLLQIRCFYEIISVGFIVYGVRRFPWFRSLSWYFLLIANYFFYGRSLITYFGVLVSKVDLVEPFVVYHRFISFVFYIICFKRFFQGLVIKYIWKQCNLFAWTHVALLIFVTQCYFMLQNLFEGLIWFIVPVSMIICNDIFAYVFGFFWGETPLIELSPKKNWEAFIGSAICTVTFGVVISSILCQYKYFVCPVDYSLNWNKTSAFDCIPSSIFQLREYQIPSFFIAISQMLGYSTIHIYPFVWYSLALSLFSSIIGTFGGIFVNVFKRSGFKHAFNVWGFGTIIPGHGGITDRFDCQLLMATFVHFSFPSFIRDFGYNSVLNQIYGMQDSLQLELFQEMNKTLFAKGLL